MPWELPETRNWSTGKLPEDPEKDRKQQYLNDLTTDQCLPAGVNHTQIISMKPKDKTKKSPYRILDKGEVEKQRDSAQNL